MSANANFDVSVVMATQGKRRSIVQAVSGILEQQHIGLELIIVVDGPEYDTDVISKLRKLQSRENIPITIIYNQQNMGQAAALNNAINRSSAQFISVIDDDDYWIDSLKLNKDVRFLKSNKKSALISSNKIIIHSVDNYQLNKEASDGNTVKITKKQLFKENPINHSAVVFVKEYYVLAGKYDESLKRSQDIDLWLRLAGIGDIYVRNELSFVYRHMPIDNFKAFRNRLQEKYIRSKINFKNGYLQSILGFQS